ncbi:MAG: spermidine/putrescine ABC transporter [Alphaproteobacteria bacterium 64-11]|nr:ABC transporter permease [Alphaproteobacteria bacterium]OJU14271.1 MAG: spermidine/putrescine ABC transporter [Alphaproteobacteria bacterium 64-11]
MRKHALLLYAFAYLAFLYVPVLVLPIFSFNDSQFIAFPLTGFTTRWYAALGADSAMLHALVNSLKVGTATALLSTLLGLLAARAVTRYRLRGTGAALGFISLPLFIPDIVLGISLLLLLGVAGLPLSLGAVVLGHLLVCVPFALTVLIARFEGFDRDLEEASADLGENGWMTFWRVTFPLILPGILASLLLAFITSFDEFLVAYFLSGTEPTLPVYIWGQLRFPERLPVVLALGAIILTTSIALVALAEYVRNLGVKRPMVGA